MNGLHRRIRVALLAGCASAATSLGAAAAAAGDAGGAPVELTASQRANAGIETLALDAAAGAPARGLTLTGRVEAGPGGRTSVVAPVSARIAEIHAAPGTNVKRGMVILVLQGPEIAAAQRSLVEARAGATAARQRRDRDRALLAEGIIPPSRMEQSEAVWAAAAAQLAQAEGALANIAGEASGRVSVRAPADGVMTGPRHPLGEVVEAGEVLAAVGTPAQLRVALAASVDAARQIAAGDAVTVRGRGCEAAAVVRAVGTVVEATQTVPVDASVPEEDGCLFAGEAVTAVVAPHAAAEGSWPVPPRAFVRRGADTFVFVERGKGFAAVQVDSAAARAGFARSPQLRKGDRVVVSGTVLLKGAWLAAAEG